MTATAPPTPTSSRERHHLVDGLRGAALLGIVVVNIAFLAQPIDGGWEPARGTVDLIVRWFVAAFATSKFFPLFALLFGYGLALQTSRSPDDAQLRSRSRRRYALLAVFGVVHGIVFFPGDILVLYALVGAVMFRVRHWSDEQLRRWATRLYAVVVAVWLIVGLLSATEGPEAAALGTGDSALTEALLDGSLGGIVAEQGRTWVFVFLFLLVFQGPVVVASFAAGIVLGRGDVLSHPERHRAALRRVLVRIGPPALLVAAIGGWLEVSGGRWVDLGTGVGLLAAPGVVATYVAALALSTFTAPRVVGVLRHAGRMSLTAYLLESVLAAAWSHGWGLGRLGTTSPLADLGLAVAIWVVVSLLAIVWMRWFRFGPLEWLLRAWSYRRRPPMRRSAG